MSAAAPLADVVLSVAMISPNKHSEPPESALATATPTEREPD